MIITVKRFAGKSLNLLKNLFLQDFNAN